MVFSNNLRDTVKVCILICTIQLIKADDPLLKSNILPHVSLSKLSDINLTALHNLGIDYLLVSKGDTIVLNNEPNIYDGDICQALKDCKQMYGENFAILTNDITWDGSLKYEDETVIYNTFHIIIIIAKLQCSQD